MTESVDKITALLIKLNQLTSLEQIKWEKQDAPKPLLRGTDDVIPLFFFTRYKYQSFGLYQRRYRLYDGDRDSLYWSETLTLAILDNEGRAIWEIAQYSPALNDLFETVRRKVANVDEIIDDLLGEPNIFG